MKTGMITNFILATANLTLDQIYFASFGFFIVVLCSYMMDR